MACSCNSPTSRSVAVQQPVRVVSAVSPCGCASTMRKTAAPTAQVYRAPANITLGIQPVARVCQSYAYQQPPAQMAPSCGCK